MVDSVYGSDIVVELLRALGIRFVTLNPGASIRGLHESLVYANDPSLVLALHEEVAVAIAHGYAKAADETMAVMLHDLVGLQHASMAIFNATIDQSPILLIGGSGPADAAQRRPWIDWIHSTRWQSLAIRDIVKWDDEPRSLPATIRSIIRGYRLAQLPPRGPTYVAIDALLQETMFEAPTLNPAAIPPLGTYTATDHDLQRVTELLATATHPVVVTDMSARSRGAFEGIRDLVEALGAPTVDLGGRHNLSNTHWADCTDARSNLLADADVVLCLDARDVEWALSEVDLRAHGSRSLIRPGAKVISIGLNELLHKGFVDLERPVDADIHVVADTAAAIPDLTPHVRAAISHEQLEHRRHHVRARSDGIRSANRARLVRLWGQQPISRARLSSAVWQAVRGAPWVLGNGTLGGWARRTWQWNDYGAYLGTSGGAGLGYGLGASIGAALAHRDDDVLVVDLQADGDLLYTASALWTAARYRLPLLIVTDNNRTYGKDRLHQSVVAAERSRGADRIDVGIDIEDPSIDLAKLAEAQGVEGFGPLTDPEDLEETLERAATLARVERRPVLVDVVTSRD